MRGRVRQYNEDNYFITDTNWTWATRKDPWAGIYFITHVETGLFYIGSSENLLVRKGNHETELRWNQHHCKRLQEAYNQSSAMYFTYWLALDAEHALIWEQSLLDQHWRDPLLANTSNNAAVSFAGYQHTDRQREKLIAHLSSPEGLAYRKKMGELSAARARRISINGVIYDSVRDAVQKLGLSESCIRERLQTRKNRHNPYSATWFFVNDI